MGPSRLTTSRCSLCGGASVSTQKYRYIKLRLFPHGSVARRCHRQSYVASSRLAMRKNPSVLFAPLFLCRDTSVYCLSLLRFACGEICRRNTTKFSAPLDWVRTEAPLILPMSYTRWVSEHGFENLIQNQRRSSCRACVAFCSIWRILA